MPPKRISTEVTMSEENPSPLALKHEREISSLNATLEGVTTDIGGVKTWMGKIERSIEGLAEEFRSSLAKTQTRNPMLYVGLGTLAMTVIVAASGVTLFAISAMVAPLREHIIIHERVLEKADEREREDHDLLIRLDERSKLRDKASVD